MPGKNALADAGGPTGGGTTLTLLVARCNRGQDGGFLGPAPVGFLAIGIEIGLDIRGDQLCDLAHDPRDGRPLRPEPAMPETADIRAKPLPVCKKRV